MKLGGGGGGGGGRRGGGGGGGRERGEGREGERKRSLLFIYTIFRLSSYIDIRSVVYSSGASFNANRPI